MSFWEILLVALALAMDALAVSVGLGLCAKGSAAGCAARAAAAFGLFQSGMTLAGWLAGRAVTGGLEEASHWIAAGILVAVSLRMLLEAFRKMRTAPRSRDPGPCDARPADSGKLAEAGSAQSHVMSGSAPEPAEPILHPLTKSAEQAVPRRRSYQAEPLMTDASRGWMLIALAVATSLDALGAGLGLGVLGTKIWAAAAVIGLVAAGLSAAGVTLAGRIARAGGKDSGKFSGAAEIAGALVLLGVAAKVALGAG